MTNEEATKIECRKAAQRDIDKGWPADARSHGADKGSSWADWYNEAYAEIAISQPKELFAEEIISHIETCEIGIPIDRFFNEDGTHITKKKYGKILIETLCTDLRAKYLNQ